MSETPAESAQSVRAFLQEQSSSPYTKVLAGAAQRVRGAVERSVRSQLERLAGLIPRAKFERVIDAASATLGRTAGILTGVGVGLLALGSGIEAQAGTITIDEHGGRNIELKHSETGETFLVVPNSELNTYQGENVPNPLFERIKEMDAKCAGINYTITNPEAFTAAVVGDANRVAVETLGMELSAVGPSEFVTLVNTLVEQRLSYDRVAAEDTDAGRAEDTKISSTPIDELYLSYQKGVCRHYAATVEAVGELLIAKGVVPKCAGMAIDEVRSGIMNHAWNVFYLNANADSRTVASSFTDATWHDSGSALDANDSEHLSVYEGVEKLKLFAPEEMEGVYKELATLHLGGIEEQAVHCHVVDVSFQEYRSLAANGDAARLSDAAFAALHTVREQSRAGGILGTDALSNTLRSHFFESIQIAARNYGEIGEYDRALSLVAEGLSFTEAMKACDNPTAVDEVFHLTKLQREIEGGRGAKR
jgi:hypothetical protein